MKNTSKPKHIQSFSPRNGEVILKLKNNILRYMALRFQSPQWGSNSKGSADEMYVMDFPGFSPRNGEVILKKIFKGSNSSLCSFSPRNGEVILKKRNGFACKLRKCFSPRNGEVILKLKINLIYLFSSGFSPRNGEVILKYILSIINGEKNVSVPAMGK